MMLNNFNPYEMDDPNIDGEDFDCTDDSPCGECDWCLEEAANNPEAYLPEDGVEFDDDPAGFLGEM